MGIQLSTLTNAIKSLFHSNCDLKCGNNCLEIHYENTEHMNDDDESVLPTDRTHIYEHYKHHHHNDWRPPDYSKMQTLQHMSASNIRDPPTPSFYKEYRYY